MIELSRRNIALSASLLAAGGLLYGVGPSEASKQLISFTAAKESFSKLLVELIDISERDFQIKYSPDQRTDIENRTWNGVQQILSVHYAAEETPPELRKKHLKHAAQNTPPSPR
jgi:hypothetical protein